MSDQNGDQNKSAENKMNVQTAHFQGVIVRYSIVSENGILFNTADVCRVLRIAERSPEGVLSNSCMNMAGIIKTALTENRNEMEFVEWLEENFIGYEIETPLVIFRGNEWAVRDDG